MKVPVYNPRAARAIGFLKRRSNDVEIYVEDTGNRSMWFFLIRKLLPATIKLKSINMLGGREVVEAACKSDQDPNDNRRRLYVIDGDFDFLIGRGKLRLNYFCRLNTYCVENLLIREDVVIEAGLKLMPKLDYAQLKIIFDFNSWFKNECETLGSLFKLYAAARCADTRIQTVGFSVQSLFIDTASGPMICKKKTLARFIHIAKKVAKLKGIDWLRNIVEKINKRSNGMSYHKIVSGKDYLMPLLLLRMKRLFSFRGTVEQLKAELASVWPGGNEYTISRALKDI